MDKDILRRPFPPELIRQRPGQNGKTWMYVETHAVIARLNDGCDAWSFELQEHFVYDNEVVVVGKLTADGIVKMAFGGSAITKDGNGRMVSLADDLKAAGSDALKKAASLLGVGLELYGGAAVVHATPQSPPQPAQPQTVPAVVDRLTSKQLATIQGVARRNGMPRAELHALVFDLSGKDGVQFLTRKEASLLLSRLGQPNGNGAHPPA